MERDPGVRRLVRTALVLAIAVAAATLAPASAPGQNHRPVKLPPDITKASALENFDFVWEEINETHFDPALNGVNWYAVRKELRPRAAECRHIDSLRTVIRHLLNRLGQSHFGLIPSDRYDTGGDVIRRALSEVPDHLSRPGPGIDVRYLDGRVVVTDVWDFGSARDAGVLRGWEVVAIDGRDCTELVDEMNDHLRGYGETNWMLDQTAYLVWALVGAALAGEDSSSVEVVFRDRDDDVVERRLERRECPWPIASFAGMPPNPVYVHSWMTDPDPRGRCFGVIEMHFVWLPGTVSAVEEALANVCDADGIILDIRGNIGGVGMAAQAVAGCFATDPFTLGTMKGRRYDMPLNVEPHSVVRDGNVIGPYAGPVAILTDPMTGSASELFTAGFKDADRARIFGEPTSGAALPAVITELPNGDRLLHAIWDFIRNTGESIEGRPIQPHVVATLTRDDLVADYDPALEAALRWLRRTAK
jgi:carboxyl-terminal processing protease